MMPGDGQVLYTPSLRCAAAPENAAPKLRYCCREYGISPRLLLSHNGRAHLQRRFLHASSRKRSTKEVCGYLIFQLLRKPLVSLTVIVVVSHLVASHSRVLSPPPSLHLPHHYNPPLSPKLIMYRLPRHPPIRSQDAWPNRQGIERCSSG